MTQTSPGLARRSFLQGGAAAAGAASLLGFEALGRATIAGAAPVLGDGGYGPLYPAQDQTTGETLIALPRGFEYLTFGRTGDLMYDGTPRRAPTTAWPRSATATSCAWSATTSGARAPRSPPG